MSLLNALRGGLAMGLKSWRIAALLWLLGLLFALPAAIFIEEAVHEYIGSSLAHESLRGPMDLAWYEEFKAEAGGVSSMVTISRLSPAAVLDNLELWFSGDLFQENAGVAALGILFALLWTLMSGGVLVHLTTSEDQPDSDSFLASSSRYFFRFLRLVIAAGLAYYLIYRFSLWLFPEIERATRDVTVERTVLLYNLVAAAFVLLLLVLVKVSIDYAKISTVVEERRSMVLAALRGAQFVVTHPVRTLGIYVAMGVLGLLLAVVYYFATPGVGGEGSALIVLALVVGQVYLLLRWVLRISLLGAESLLYRSAQGYLRRDSSRF